MIDPYDEKLVNHVSLIIFTTLIAVIVKIIGFFSWLDWWQLFIAPIVSLVVVLVLEFFKGKE